MSGRPAALWPVYDRATSRRGRRPAPSARDLDRVPVVHEVQFAGLLAGLGHGPDREDAAVDAHVADLGLVRDAARAR